MIQINNREFLDKYTNILIEIYKLTMQTVNVSNNDFYKINMLVNSIMQRMIYENRLWTHLEVIVYLTQTILFDKPFLDGNKRIGFALLLKEVGVDKYKIFEICQYLWIK